MTQEQILVTVKKIIAEVLETPVAKITDDSSQKTIQNWDSLAHLKLVMELENKFKIAFNTEEVFTMESVRDICQMIKNHLS